jgi:hypothetical protein
VLSCRGAAPPDESAAPRFVVGIGPGPGMTAFTATFTRAADLRYRDAHCTATSLNAGAEAPSLDGGRVEAWVAGGQVLGHVDRSPDGMYRAAVRASLPPGTRLAASVAGGPEVPAHRFRSPAKVPANVRHTAPAQGFNLRAGSGLEVRWEGGDSSHVSLTLSLEPPQGTVGAGLLVTCVVPRAPGAFTIPAAAVSPALVPAEARSVQLLVAATDRVREGDYALDVVPLGGEDDQVVGAYAR